MFPFRVSHLGTTGLKSLTDASCPPFQAKSIPSSLSPSVPLAIPWTISNRYYTAEVHFSVWTIDTLFPEVFARQPPAVVFTWFEDEVKSHMSIWKINLTVDSHMQNMLRIL